MKLNGIQKASENQEMLQLNLVGELHCLLVFFGVEFF